RRSLDVGSGAGNYTLRLLEELPDLDVDLLDLSAPMLERAQERLEGVARGAVRTIQADIREAELAEGAYDVIMAGATLHHLRGEEEWHAAFAKLHAALAEGGSLWISDLVEHTLAPVHEMMWGRYGDYLTVLRDEAYRQHVFDYIEKEDSPRPLTWQLDLLKQAGFSDVEVLHKNGPFAAFGAVKTGN
ncbi:MAG TPA: class I SAM-dependent methyltransferase, partial [Deinococcales bacterium]|nr:class I SAM-dependent methyltransferase [Deinococcales bacterium]